MRSFKSVVTLLCSLVAFVTLACATHTPPRPKRKWLEQLSHNEQPLVLDPEAARGCSGSIRSCRRQCLEQEVASACVGMSIAYAYGRGVMKNEDTMLAYEAFACEFGSATGCRFLANSLAGDPQTRQDAMRLHDRACRAGDERSCRILLRTAFGGYPATPSRWARLAAQAGRQCIEFHHARECELIGDIMRLGLAEEPDLVRAKVFYEHACEYAGNDAERCYPAHGHYGLLVYEYLPTRMEPNSALLRAYGVWKAAADTSRSRAQIRVAYCVTAFGETKDVRIVEGSGDERLDKRVLEMVRAAEFGSIRSVKDPQMIVGCTRGAWIKLGPR